MVVMALIYKSRIDGNKLKRIQLQTMVGELERYIAKGVMTESDPLFVEALEACRRGHTLAMSAAIGKFRAREGIDL
jgi:hypothetical protein